MSKILNRSIVILDYKITDSRYEGKCLNLQISLGATRHVVFTGSKPLTDTIQKIPPESFPFVTVIEEKDDGSFRFT